MTTRILLVAVLISQFALGLMLADIEQAVRSQPDTVAMIAQLKADIQHLTHPQTIQKRTLEYILRQGEFEGVQ